MNSPAKSSPTNSSSASLPLVRKHSSPTTAQLTQRQLAWLCYITKGAAANIHSARFSNLFGLRPAQRERIARRLDQVYKSLSDLADEVYNELQRIDK